MARRDESSADLHSPEELLATADALVALADPQMYRAAVLEAITALEATSRVRSLSDLNCYWTRCS